MSDYEAVQAAGGHKVIFRRTDLFHAAFKTLVRRTPLLSNDTSPYIHLPITRRSVQKPVAEYELLPVTHLCKDRPLGTFQRREQRTRGRDGGDGVAHHGFSAA